MAQGLTVWMVHLPKTDDKANYFLIQKGVILGVGRPGLSLLLEFRLGTSSDDFFKIILIFQLNMGIDLFILQHDRFKFPVCFLISQGNLSKV